MERKAKYLRKTVEIRPHQFRALRAEAMRRGITMRDLLERILESALPKQITITVERPPGGGKR